MYTAKLTYIHTYIHRYIISEADFARDFDACCHRFEYRNSDLKSFTVADQRPAQNRSLMDAINHH